MKEEANHLTVKQKERALRAFQKSAALKMKRYRFASRLLFEEILPEHSLGKTTQLTNDLKALEYYYQLHFCSKQILAMHFASFLGMQNEKKIKMNKEYFTEFSNQTSKLACKASLGVQSSVSVNFPLHGHAWIFESESKSALDVIGQKRFQEY